MQRVLVVDKSRKPLMPCNPARARQLLKQGKAAVLRYYPFTIILKERENGDSQETQLKLDVGAKITGIAIVASFKHGLRCIWVAELIHRGFAIRDNLIKRRQLRHSRRHRKTRYRMPRFLNRHTKAKWLAPSLLSRLNNIVTWNRRLSNSVPFTHLSLELAKFDTQLLQNPETRGIKYQQGELAGYEIREYLLEKWKRKCAYCGKTDIPLEIEHIIPKSRGGSSRVKNLTLSCRNCNQKKNKQTAQEFGYPLIHAQAIQAFNASGIMNQIRWVVFEFLKSLELPVEVGTGGRTKFNRMQQNYPKTHWIDAVCVGESGACVFIHSKHQPLFITAKGRQCRQMTLPNKFGFPRTKAKKSSKAFGFRTGDFVNVNVPVGKNTGKYLGQVAIRATGSFDIRTYLGPIQGVSYRYCELLQHADGYFYEKRESAISFHNSNDRASTILG